jgi:hypothetical protein
MSISEDDPKTKRPKAKPPPESAPRPTAAEFAALSATNEKLTARNATLETQLAAWRAEPRPPPPPPPEPPPEPFLRLKEAAGLAGVLYNRSLTWLTEGLLESEKRGGRHFVRLSSLIAQRKFRDGR